MKRGLITWDKSEIPPEVFQRRIDLVRGVLKQRELSALVVYSDLWRSNQARFFSNFMPVFQSGAADHSGRCAAHTAMRPFASRLWMDSLSLHNRRRTAGGKLRQTAIRDCRREAMDQDRSSRIRTVPVRPLQGYR